MGTQLLTNYCEGRRQGRKPIKPDLAGERKAFKLGASGLRDIVMCCSLAANSWFEFMRLRSLRA